MSGIQKKSNINSLGFKTRLCFEDYLITNSNTLLNNMFLNFAFTIALLFSQAHWKLTAQPSMVDIFAKSMTEMEQSTGNM